ncbi:MAG: 4-(cytidine 5'-diphospho)-2-C-methyl-D-erythritol kinase [Lautropia sp.]
MRTGPCGAAPRPAELRNLPAPAKLNLFLHVTGRRRDGYHLLETVFQFVDLCDRIDLFRRDDGVIARRGAPPGVPEALDLTLRAARALQAATGSRYGVEIALAKTIPIGAGLGGGSSDAATVLLGLDRLWGLGLSRRELIEIARPLGADVPVFVHGRNAYATGIGDRFRPVALAPCWYVLLMPPAGIATQSVFADPKLTRDTKPLTISGFSRAYTPTQLPGRNDLEAVVSAREPAVAAALARLRTDAHAVAPRASVRMTGSGACVFAAAGSREAAQAIAAELQASGPQRSSGREKQASVGTVHLVTGLAEHPLGSRQVG